MGFKVWGLGLRFGVWALRLRLWGLRGLGVRVFNPMRGWTHWLSLKHLSPGWHRTLIGCKTVFGGLRDRKRPRVLGVEESNARVLKRALGR